MTRLATGGMAEIWLARQAGPKGFEKVVVIKKIIDSLSEDPEFIEMLLDEARIAAQLSHPNIVQILDLGQADGSYYIAMEYLAGESLAAVARAGKKASLPLPLSHAVRIIASAAEGLAYAHTKPDLSGKPLEIIHRDISPQNLVITYDGIVKIVDFGIAKAANRSSNTLDGRVKGKVHYMSPEQARGDPLDARTDVFALGVVLWEAITGRRLIQGENTLLSMEAIGLSTAPFPRAKEVNAAVPPELEEVVARAIERDRGRRFPSARAFQSALEAWLRTRDDTPGATELGSYMELLFRDRIRERGALIEAARVGGVPPEETRLRRDTEPSMPGRSNPAPAHAPLRRWWLGAVGGALLVMGSLGGALLWRATPFEPALHAEVPSVPPVLPPAPVSRPTMLRVSTHPPGAQVLVDGALRGVSPVEVPALVTGEHEVIARLAGHQEVTRPVRIDREGATLEVMLDLPAVQDVKPPVAVPPPRRRPPAKRGYLTLDTSPWTEVYLNGRKLGDTPLVKAAVPAGKLKLTLKNPEKGLERFIELTVPPDQTTAKRLSF
ncbi:MAG: serine/threonine-protein kinase [Myxococcota bacterium]